MTDLLSKKMDRSMIGALLTGYAQEEWNEFKAEAVVLEKRVKRLEDALSEIKQLLGPESGYHIAPDKGSGEFIEAIRIESIFDRANKALAAEEK